jgi:xanthine dehydrogenase accessory factor
MDAVYKELEKELHKGSTSVIATIVKQAGPSPRGIGAKILIREDGSCAGTIGGGCLEARAFEEAGKLFTTEQPVLLKFALTGTDVAATDMLCGGMVEVFLEPVSPENPDVLAVFEKVIETSKQGGAGLLVTALNAELWEERRFPVLFLEKGGGEIGGLPRGRRMEKVLREQMGRLVTSRQPVSLLETDDSGRSLSLFVEPIVSNPVLYVFGGGHVSRQIVPLANLVGFHVEVIDDRAEFVQPANFPAARAVRQLSFQKVMEQLPIDPSSFLVIVTRGHIHDKTVLAQALKSRAGYIGMIGSRRKRELIYRSLLDEGFSNEDLARVHSPIGLKIGAETPEEIAVSIVAELIQVRAEMD